MSVRGLLEQYQAKIPGQILMTRISGSYGYNLAFSGSDKDFFGVYVLSLKDTLSIHPPKETIDIKAPDAVFHEAAKFARLLSNGNPTTVESLFDPNVEYSTPLWNELAEHRVLFINKRTLAHYLGYAIGQVNRFFNKHPESSRGELLGGKCAYHAVRLLNNVEEMLKGGSPTVWWEGRGREDLLKIRNREIDVWGLMDDQYKRIDRLWEELDKSKLPPKMDESILNEWLYNVKMRSIYEAPAECRFLFRQSGYTT